MKLIKSGYLRQVYDNDYFVKLVDQAARVLKRYQKKVPFDALVFTGCSGAALAYPLSYKLKVPLVCIRKSTEKAHYTRGLTEGFINITRYLIVDDFIESGDTIKNILSNMSMEVPEAQCITIALWKRLTTDPRDPFQNIPCIGLAKEDYNY